MEAKDVICIACGKPALARCTTDAGRREVLISKLCEPCWFEWAGIEPDPAGDDDQDAYDDEG